MVLGDIDTLLNWGMKLFNYRKEKRAGVLKEEVLPVFEQFEKTHSDYLEAFSRYREQIINAAGADWIRPLQTTLEKDNLFSGDVRSKIVRLSEELEGETFGPFVESICNYLMSARLVEPLGKQIHPHHVQRWRQGLLQTLERIQEEDWQLVLDPEAAQPPLSPKEISQELKQITGKYKHLFSRKVPKEDLVKRSAALWALETIVNEMQNQYDLVCQAYADLRKKLSN
jgi:hypothetical protein